MSYQVKLYEKNIHLNICFLSNIKHKVDNKEKLYTQSTFIRVLLEGSKMKANKYYKPCKELDTCNELIEKYYQTKQYKKCFEGHLVLAEKNYPLAECQVGFFYWAGLGVEKNPQKAFYWTERSAIHGDWDAQFNLGKFFEEGYSVDVDLEKAKYWYKEAALQKHDMAIKKCDEFGILTNETII